MEIEKVNALIDKYNKTGIVPEELKQFKSTFIGQGWGWKSDKPWHLIKNNEVCYFPECSYVNIKDDNTASYYPTKYGYCKKDFINLVGSVRGEDLFQSVDWQTPEILAAELEWVSFTGKDRYVVNDIPEDHRYCIWDTEENCAYGDVFGNTFYYDDYEEALEACDELNVEE